LAGAARHATLLLPVQAHPALGAARRRMTPDLLTRPRTKIVATIGPTTRSATAIDALLAAGIDLARVNCAHGSHDELRATIALLRERREAAGRPLAILADLAGPKLRVGRLRDGSAELEPDATLVLTTDDVLG